MTSENKSWQCKGISIQRNTGMYVLGWIAFATFWFFAIFLLFMTYVSVIGLESVDLTAQLLQYWNPATNPFVWVLIAILAISVILMIIAYSVRKACTD